MARTGSISVVRVHGPLSRAVGQARNAALVELADAQPPWSVTCPVSPDRTNRGPCRCWPSSARTPGTGRALLSASSVLTTPCLAHSSASS
jgi:hypothetical protein